MKKKEIILGATSAVSSAIMFWLWDAHAIPALVGGDFQGYSNVIIPIAALVAGASCFGLGAIFIRDPWVAYGAALAGSAIPYLVSGITPTVFILLPIAAIITAFGVHKIRREFFLSVGFSVSKIAKSGMALYFTVAALTISFLYAGALSQKNALATILPKPAFDFTLHHLLNSEFARSAAGITQMRKDATADELLEMLAREQLKKQGIDPLRIPPAEVARLRAGLHEEIARQYGIAFQGNEKVQDIFYTAVAQRADELLGPYRAYLPLVSALAFFFALKALTLPISLMSLAVMFVLIKALRSVKILTRTTQHIEVERLTL